MSENDERRRSLRTDLESELIMKRLDRPSDKTVKIEVLDVSKTGIGFKSNEHLEIGSIYECLLTIWTKEVIRAFVEIVRGAKEEDDMFSYGGIFVGMLDMDAYRIEVYQTVKTLQDESIENKEEEGN